MVALGGVLLALGLAPFGRVTGKLERGVDGERGHAGTREAEMIRPVVVAGAGLGIGLDVEAEGSRGPLHDGKERRAFGTRDVHRLRHADGRDRVEIQVECDLRRRDRQMLAEIVRAEQALFLRGDGREQHRVRRPGGRPAEGVSELEHNPAARAVVHGAVVDLVAGKRGIDAEMIVMSGVHHRLRGGPGIGARQQPEHIVGDERAHPAVDVRLEPHRQRPRFELARPRGLDHASRSRPDAANNRRATSSWIHAAASSFGS